MRLRKPVKIKSKFQTLFEIWHQPKMSHRACAHSRCAGPAARRPLSRRAGWSAYCRIPFLSAPLMLPQWPNPIIYTCIHIYIHTYMHTYIYTYIHTYIYTYIHNALFQQAMGGGYCTKLLWPNCNLVCYWCDIGIHHPCSRLIFHDFVFH